MEVILREHVDNLGRRGEIVKVADGYARNFLLPRNLALPATDANKQRISRERKIVLQEPIKKLGEFDVPVRLQRDVTATIKVKVAPEGEAEKAAQKS